MPQMSPMNWILIFTLVITLFLYTLSNLNMMKKENKSIMNYKKINKKMEW